MKKISKAEMVNLIADKTGFTPELVAAFVRHAGGKRAFEEMAPDVYNHGALCGVPRFTYYHQTRPLVQWAPEIARVIGEGIGLSAAGLLEIMDVENAADVADMLAGDIVPRHNLVLAALEMMAAAYMEVENEA